MNFEQAVAQVADRYRCEGYQVIEHPRPDQVPPVAEGHQATLLAHKAEDSVLVLVKARREDLRNDQGALRLAEAVEGQPGWQLDLVVLNLDALAYPVTAEASEPPVEKIAQDLAHAEQLSAAGEVPVAFVMSWASLEAAMRRAARGVGLDVSNGTPSFLLRALSSDGFLAREEFDRLDQALEVRNAVVHGLAVPPIDPAAPRYVVAVARRLLSTNGKTSPG